MGSCSKFANNKGDFGEIEVTFFLEEGESLTTLLVLRQPIHSMLLLKFDTYV